MRARILTLLVAITATLPAQGIPLEYRVKAAYLYNFVKFVEWPTTLQSSVLTICVAGRNPFETVLDDLVGGAVVAGRRLESRVILEPTPGCHVLFVPQGANAGAYLRAVVGQPILTIGEEPGFILSGGIARFYVDGINVRFEINPTAAEHAGLRISSRLLRLARIVGAQGRSE